MNGKIRDPELTYDIIGAAMEVHRHLGPGLLESAYKTCLIRELGLRGHVVENEAGLDVEYKGTVVPNAYRLDLVVDAKVIVELKSVEALTSTHEAQLLTYMKLRRLPIGLLFNFNQPSIRKDFRRFVRDF